MGLLSFLSELFGGGDSQKVTWGQAQRGVQSLQARRNANPIEYLTELIGLQTDNTSRGGLLTKRAEHYQNSGEHQKAIDDYTEAIEIFRPANARKGIRGGPSFEELRGRAKSLEAVGEYFRAIGDYTRMIEQRPDSYDSHVGMGRCYQKAGYPDDAARFEARANALRRR